MTEYNTKDAKATLRERSNFGFVDYVTRLTFEQEVSVEEFIEFCQDLGFEVRENALALTKCQEALQGRSKDLKP